MAILQNFFTIFVDFFAKKKEYSTPKNLIRHKKPKKGNKFSIC
jgi:hypothetical protein